MWLALLVCCIIFLEQLEFAPCFDTRITRSDLTLYGSITFSAFTLFYFLVQAFLAVFYRPSPDMDEEKLPFVTVIIPAYNEGRQVAETIHSVMRSDYPSGKFEVIVINDGSRDDTWECVGLVWKA